MKNNIVITGGGLVNKGAQAMTFIAVDEIKKRYPDSNIYVLSEEDKCYNSKCLYNFEFIGWFPMKFSKAQKNPLLKLLCLLRNRNEFKKAEAIYKNAILMIDISGYALGSNWSDKICLAFLEKIEFAQGFDIPVYLMPQSFGPLDFKEGSLVDKKAREVLSKVKCICAREPESYDALVTKYSLTNVILTPDLVLNNKGIDESNVFKGTPCFDNVEIKENSVGLIPNMRNLQVGNGDEVIDLYSAAVDCLLAEGKNVYILSHSDLDFTVCKKIKEKYENNDNMTLLDNDFSCVEFNELVKKFDFLVASRFHSIVHAFKNGIPCVAVGWADKYRVLLDSFEQAGYMFDVREDSSKEILVEKIKKMATCYKCESEKILCKLDNFQRNNVFDIIKQE